jgi:hypothetical protein
VLQVVLQQKKLEVLQALEPLGCTSKLVERVSLL